MRTCRAAIEASRLKLASGDLRRATQLAADAAEQVGEVVMYTTTLGDGQQVYRNSGKRLWLGIHLKEIVNFWRTRGIENISLLLSRS